MGKQANVIYNGKNIKVNCGALLSDVTDIHLPCGGHGNCKKCKVIASGALSPLTEIENECLTEKEISEGIRLACRTVILGDCTVTSIEKNGSAGILTDTFVSTPHFSKPFKAYGVAIDVGTTTLAAKIYDASGNPLCESARMNPQSTFGDDVISRIESALNGNRNALSESVIKALDEMLAELARGAGVSAHDVDSVVITGNTTMLHLLTGESPEPLSHAPFCIKRRFGEALSAQTLGLKSVNPYAEVYLPPCISAFVGADAVSAICATGICSGPVISLLADIGTNGEMALWDGKQLSVCSTAAGPAFEGVGISMGMRGTEGAIDKVVLRNGIPFAHVIGNVAPIGICGSGLVDAVACLLQNETLDMSGALDDDTAEIAFPVVLTRQDIRMVQLAKSAINAGIRTLLHATGVSFNEVSEFFVAGGFGNYLNMKNAAIMGLIPKELVGKVRVIGNAALTGASMFLLDKELRNEAERISRMAKVINLATDPFFAEEYISGMSF